MTDGIRLKISRIYLGLEQEELAKRIGFTKSYISRLESNDRKMPEKLKQFTYDVFAKMCREYKNYINRINLH